MLTNKNQKAKYHRTTSLKKKQCFWIRRKRKDFLGVCFQYLCFEFFLW